MTKRQVLAEHSSAELTEWMGFYMAYPFGPGWENERWARSHAAFANANRDRQKRPEPFEPGEFLPGWREPEQSVEEQIELMRAYTGKG